MNFLYDYEGDNEVLMVTRGCDGNTFEIKQNGRHSLYGSDTYDA